MGLIRSTFRIGFVLVVVLVLVLALPFLRTTLLTTTGSLLTHEDPLQHADVAVVTVETRHGGALEAADLYRDRYVPRVVVLVQSPREPEVELARRGIHEPSATDLLERLGVPRAAVVEINAGEGGTTEGSAALAKWCRAHPIKRMIVIVSPHHATRVRRALRRDLGDRGPVLAIRMTKYNAFRASTWWQSRATVREGIVELEKLALDWIAHPFG
jgi:hypothetical protein